MCRFIAEAGDKGEVLENDGIRNVASLDARAGCRGCSRSKCGAAVSVFNIATLCCMYAVVYPPITFPALLTPRGPFRCAPPFLCRHCATVYGRCPSCVQLDQRDKWRETPLHKAARLGSAEVVKALCAARMKVHRVLVICAASVHSSVSRFWTAGATPQRILY